MREFLRNNGLSLVLLACLLVPLVGQVLTGHKVYNEELVREGGAPLTLAAYLTSGHLVSSVFENWESEFLQMAAYVLFTVFLRQKGSAESKPFSGEQAVDRDPRLDRNKRDAPYPVRRGGWLLRLYEWSLSLAFFALFILAFVWHMAGGYRLENDERVLDGLPPVTFGEFISSAEFWFQSLQNWQSEFLAVGAIVVLSIWLRQRGSPESKPVSAPHDQTGE